jgi:hypothetical protein
MDALIKFVKLIGFIYAIMIVAMIGLVLLSNVMVAMI